MNRFYWEPFNPSPPPPKPITPSTPMLIDDNKKIFNLDELRQRGFIRAQYHTWPEPRNGIVVALNETMIQVLFLTQIRTAAQYFRIPAIEVVEGKWAIRYSNDMETFFDIEMTYGVDDDDCNCHCGSDCCISNSCCSVEAEQKTEGDNSDWGYNF